MQKIVLNVPENMLKFELSAQIPVRRYVMAPRYSWEHRGFFKKMSLKMVISF